MTLKPHYQLMNAEEVHGTLRKLAEEILYANASRDLVLVGIQRRGVPMAQRMAATIARLTNVQPLLGILDINLYRDDLTHAAVQPIVRRTELPPHIDDKDVILVDDVLYTGRTVGAALRALTDFGRMRSIQLAVFVDRGHRELPVEANFTGRKITTRNSEVVEVRMSEIDGEDAIYVMEKA
jgi:pyrimidine operon attenuation protein/uracil phosphoribosyltransferase